MTDAQYDTHGNTTSLGDTTHKTEFGYDVSDRNTSIKSSTKETVFARDAQDRIVGREQKVSGNTTSNVGYSFTGSGDTPDALLDGSGNVIQKYVSLPGDVLVTIKTNSQSAGATTFSLPNIHGDVMATVNADGALLDTFMTGPFGEVLPNQPAPPSGALVPMSNPTNTADGTTWNYVGQHEKITDLDTSPVIGGITQMGARLYIPTLGRFLSVDPVEGGTPNNYVYALDPVNQYDLNGKWIQIAAVIARIATIGSTICTKLCKPVGNFLAHNKIRLSIRNDKKPDHWFPDAKGVNGKVWRSHIQIEFQVIRNRKAVFEKKIHIPYGPKYKYKYGKGGTVK